MFEEFNRDDKWQREMRDDILVPCLYAKRFAGRHELIPHTDPRAKGGCDTIVNGHRLDEKIVRYPRDDNGVPRADPYDAFALETMSCTVTGHERDGWMRTNDVSFVLYCFANLDETELDCYLLDFPKLKDWFWPRAEQYHLWTSKQFNRTQCRVVPIYDVHEAGIIKQQYLFEKPFSGRCACGVPGLHVMYEGLVKTGKQIWFCQEHKPVTWSPTSNSR
jgi:hypothetical protein